MSLRERILSAESGIRVSEIVAPHTLAMMPASVRNRVAPMQIEWMPNRAWGMSFRLGDPVVKIGHKMGHHIAQHPEIGGYKLSTAENILRREVEGTILHEIGHAVFDEVLEQRSPRDRRRVFADLAKIALAQGPPSSYTGMCVGGQCIDGSSMSDADRLHEMVAEAWRWWIGDRSGHFAEKYPGWTLFCRWLVQQLNQHPNAAAA